MGESAIGVHCSTHHSPTRAPTHVNEPSDSFHGSRWTARFLRIQVSTQTHQKHALARVLISCCCHPQGSPLVRTLSYSCSLPPCTTSDRNAYGRQTNTARKVSKIRTYLKVVAHRRSETKINHHQPTNQPNVSSQFEAQYSPAAHFALCFAFRELFIAAASRQRIIRVCCPFAADAAAAANAAGTRGSVQFRVA